MAFPAGVPGWVVGTGALVALLAGGVVLERVMYLALHALLRRTQVTWDERLLTHLRPAFVLLWCLVLVRAGLPWVEAAPAVEARVVALLRPLGIVGLLWLLVRTVVFGQREVEGTAWLAQRPGMRSLLPLGSRLLRALFVVLAGLAVASALGYPVTTVLAGLGIGGIAVAFGAQKTVEHLFGSIALASDQPMRVGDTIRVGPWEGEVEAIGLRSTRIRTMDRTLVTIPNGRMAEMEIESLTARDRFRFDTVLTLEYGTPSATLRAVLEALRAYLEGHPRVWPEMVRVRLQALGDHSLDIRVLCWFETTDVAEFHALREEALLRMLAIIEGAGASLAYPTQTIALRKR